MMVAFDSRAAALLAATEVLPAEWRDLSEVLLQAGGDWLSQGGLDEAVREDALRLWLQQNLDYGRVEYWAKRLDRLAHDLPRVRMASVTDPEYPQLLRQSWDRPPFIFYDGTLVEQDSRSIAIVGSREAGTAALEAAWEIAAMAARQGVTVVSGLARGVDTAAHEGALEGGGRTLAVLGCGIDMDRRVRQGGLADEIRNSGALISQFRPGSPASRSSFPMRNAVISALSAVSLLVDAGERSGTRSEADHAVRQGRRVLLWAPMMGEMRWAQEFARTPGVDFVESVDEALAIAKIAVDG